MAKQQKYAVFSITDLKGMISKAEAKTHSKSDARTVVLRFEAAGKKWPGQLWLKRVR